MFNKILLFFLFYNSIKNTTYLGKYPSKNYIFCYFFGIHTTDDAYQEQYKRFKTQ